MRRTTCPQCRKKLGEGERIHPDCVSAWADTQAAKAERAQAKAIKTAAKEDRAETKRRKERLKTRADVLKEAKVAVQAYRRLEELSKGRGCMSCGRSREEVESGEWRPGGYWDGGHFKSKGAFPELALEPLNIWLQCKSCNAGSGKYARKGYTVNSEFERNLALAEGLALVDWLNGPHEPKHYDMAQLAEMRDGFKAKVKQLKSEM